MSRCRSLRSFSICIKSYLSPVGKKPVSEVHLMHTCVFTIQKEQKKEFLSSVLEMLFGVLCCSKERRGKRGSYLTSSSIINRGEENPPAKRWLGGRGGGLLRKSGRKQGGECEERRGGGLVGRSGACEEKWWGVAMAVGVAASV